MKKIKLTFPDIFLLIFGFIFLTRLDFLSSVFDWLRTFNTWFIFAGLVIWSAIERKRGNFLDACDFFEEGDERC